MRAGGMDDLHDVAADFVVHVRLPHQLLTFHHLRRRDDRLQGFNGMPQPQTFQHRVFRLKVRIAHAHPDQETIQLGLGQRKRAFVVNWILRGDQKKRRLQFVIDPIHRHLLFRHGFQQCRLRPRGRAIDLIRQHRLGEQGARPEFEGRRLRIEYRAAGDVVGQEVRGALNPLERAADTPRQRARKHGFGHPGYILQ